MTLQDLLVAGITFRPMTESDYQGFAGADHGSLIAESEVAVYILSGNNLSVLTEDSQNDYVFGNTNNIEF